jgi:hypothetical protein
MLLHIAVHNQAIGSILLIGVRANAGVCSSVGTIYDFAAFGVTRGNFAFGHPTRFLQLDWQAADSIAGGSAERWDRSLEQAAAVFDPMSYSLLANNCHDFCQYFLEHVRLGGSRSWPPIRLVRISPLSSSCCFAP